MKTIFKTVSLLLLVCTAAAFAQNEDDGGKPKIAVYMTSGNIDAAEDKVLSTRMLAAISKSGLFRPIERMDAFLAQVTREHKKQESGAIDDAQVLKAGRQYGVQYLCLGDITEALGIIQISARIVDAKTADVITIAVKETESSANMTGAMDKVVSEMTPAVVKALSRK